MNEKLSGNVYCLINNSGITPSKIFWFMHAFNLCSGSKIKLLRFNSLIMIYVHLFEQSSVVVAYSK